MQIQAENLHFAYPGGVIALDGVSLTIQPGEKVALVGENGSGKTTLARHLNGLLRPQSGGVWVGDWQIADHSPAQMARRVAYTFQNPDEQLFCQQIWDEVAFGPQTLGYPAAQVRAMVEAALETMQLSDVARVNPRDLGYSGRKRVGLACALAMQTPVLILDEPTASLDAREQELLAQLIAARHGEGKTILVISHDMDFVAENLDRVVLMHHGQIALDAQAGLFFAQAERLETAGLALPQITRLNQRLGGPRTVLNVEEFLQDRQAPA